MHASQRRDATFSSRHVTDEVTEEPMNRSALWRAAAVGAVASFTFTACSSASGPAGEPAASESAVSLAPAPEARQLADVCPANVGIQLQWQPQSDMGAVFGMLGPGYQVDTDDKSVTGPLVAGGR